MSEIITDKLTGKTSAGDVTITSEGGSATMQLQQGVAKAWSGIDAHTSVSQFDSFNITTITDTSSGLQSHNLSNPFSDTTFCCTGSCNGGNIANFGGIEVQNATLGAGFMVTRTFRTDTNQLADLNHVYVVGHGDLA
jgi:hypothetical protein